MTITEMKEAIKDVVMKEVEQDKSEKLITPARAATVAPVIENAISKVSLENLK